MTRTARCLAGAAVLLAASCGAWSAEKPAPAPSASATRPDTRIRTVTVKECTGTAQRLVSAPGAEPKWVPLKVGERLSELTVIRTGFRTRVVLGFEDNSEVVVNRATKMGISEFRKVGKVTRTRLGLKYGSLRANVSKARGPNDFSVETPVATLAVTGTAGSLAFAGDSGFRLRGTRGSWLCRMGSRRRRVSGTEGTGGRLWRYFHALQQRFRPMLGDCLGGLPANEARGLLTKGGGRGTFGFIAGGRGGRRILRSTLVQRSSILLPGMDINIGD